MQSNQGIFFRIASFPLERERMIVRSGLFILLLAGALIRFLYLMELQAHPDFQVPMEYQIDMGFNDNTAMALAQYCRRQLRLPPIEVRFERIIEWTQRRGEYLYRPPTYTVFLAALYFVLGDCPFGVRAAQMTLGLCAACLGYLLGKRLYNRFAGLCIYLLMLFYWPLIIYESALHSPIMALFTGVLFLYAAICWAQEGGRRRAALMGLALSAYALSVTAMLIALPLILFWMFWVYGKKFTFNRAIRGVAGAILVFLGAFLVPIFSVTTYNYVVSRDFVLISGVAGMTVYIGNQPDSTGYLGPSDSMLDRFLEEEEHSLRIDQKAARVPWPEVSETAYRIAVDYIRAHPGWFVRLSLKRALLFWSPQEISQNITEYCDRFFSRTLSWLPGNFTVVMAIALLGLGFYAHAMRDTFRRWRTDKSHAADTPMLSLEGYALILILVLVWYGPYCLLWVSAHFRAPLLPHLFIFGALGICRGASVIRMRQWRTLAWGAIGPAVIVPVMLLVPVSYEDDIERWVYFRTRHYLESNQPERAAEIAQRVVERAPDHAFAQMTYANILRGLGDNVKALAHFDQALALGDDSIDVANVAENIGIIRRELGDNDGAEAAFSLLLDLDSERYAALHGLGNIAYERGQYVKAVGYLEQAARLAPEKANTHFLLGLSLNAIGETERARDSFRAGLLADPDDIWILLALADLESGLSENEAACQLYEKALTIDPRNERARHGFDTICVSEDMGKTMLKSGS